MATIATINTWDDDAESQAADYVPVGFINGVASWKLPANTSAGDRKLITSMLDANPSRTNSKLHLRLVAPKEVQIDGVWEVASVGIVDMTVTIPDNWTAVDRAKLANNARGLIVTGSPFHKYVHLGEHTT